MQSQITVRGIRFGMWYFNKSMRKVMQGLFVDTASVKMIKELIASNHKVILMPLYKSFSDFFVQLYVMTT